VVIDWDAGEISLPLDAYEMTAIWTEHRELEHARQDVLGSCMIDAGEPYSAAAVELPMVSSVGDRYYGLWNVSRVETFGVVPPMNPLGVAFEGDRAREGGEWLSTFDLCVEAVATLHPNLWPDPSDVRLALVFSLKESAYLAALDDPLWKGVRSDWEKCLTANGLSLRLDQNAWTSDEALRLSRGEVVAGLTVQSVGLVEARCNDSTEMTMRLANVEAGYQQTLIESHAADLEPALDMKREALKDARQILAEG
jgi:hypothetical protein